VVGIWRWLVIASGVLVLVALPVVISAWPAHQSSIGAGELLDRIRASGSVSYSGFAESSGGLALPVTRRLSGVGDLLGGTTQLRVWWRDQRTWRVDTIGVAGETDVHVWPRGTWTWNYESNRAVWSGSRGGPDDQPAVRLPESGDLLPTNLARRLLSQARPGEVSRLPSKRVAGRSAPGLRLRPAASQSTIEHVDVWADAGTGIALRVDVVGKGSSATVVTTSFLDVSVGTPAQRDIDFRPPRGADVRIEDDPDLATAIDRFQGVIPPGRLAGLARNPDLPLFGSIGVYGSGVTELAAVPLPDRVAFSLADQLDGVARKTKAGLVMSVGPLSLLLTRFVDEGTWLLTGTVTTSTLVTAAEQMPPLRFRVTQ